MASTRSRVSLETSDSLFKARETVIAELEINRDAGFIRPGMKAVIKLEAYPFTRYGVLHALVERVSPDSTVDQKRGLVFPVRLKITGSSLKVPGSKALSPGMSASAEIVTGTPPQFTTF